MGLDIYSHGKHPAQNMWDSDMGEHSSKQVLFLSDARAVPLEVLQADPNFLHYDWLWFGIHFWQHSKPRLRSTCRFNQVLEKELISSSKQQLHAFICIQEREWMPFCQESSLIISRDGGGSGFKIVRGKWIKVKNQLNIAAALNYLLWAPCYIQSY